MTEYSVILLGLYKFCFRFPFNLQHFRFGLFLVTNSVTHEIICKTYKGRAGRPFPFRILIIFHLRRP